MEESTTQQGIGQAVSGPEGAGPWGSPPLLGQEWAQVVSGLGIELEGSVWRWKALQRRRAVKSASDLLRLIWAYALWDWPLRLVGAWATLIGLGALSDVAVLKRLRHAQAWLGYLGGQGLRLPCPIEGASAVRVRLVDATGISRPGSVGTDWRGHVNLNVGRGCLEGIEVTDAKGGETLARHPARKDDILVADRGYGQAWPVSLWRLRGLGYAALRQAVHGAIPWPPLLSGLPRLRRYLCDAPRQRPQQAAQTRVWLQTLTQAVPAMHGKEFDHVLSLVA